jgi:secondary thiamine-phosphate synthase enzyme
MISHFSLEVVTHGKGLTDITERVADFLLREPVQEGLCNLFVCHTSASLVIQENADPDVLTDLLGWFERHVQDDHPAYTHTLEGPDDMSAHIRSALTHTSLSIPICAGKLALGTWQGIYLFEHRVHPMTRKVVVSLYR